MIDQIPLEVLEQVASYLNPKDLHSLRHSCSTMLHIVPKTALRYLLRFKNPRASMTFQLIKPGLLLIDDYVIQKIIERGCLDLLELVVRSKKPFNLCYAFEYSCQMGRIELVHELIKLGIGEEAVLNGFIIACQLGHLDVVKLLFRNCDVGLQMACANGNYNVVEYLVKRGVRPNKAGFKQASKRGYVEVVELLLAVGVDPSMDDNYPICIACEYGRFEVVKLLLNDFRVDPSAKHNECICLAAMNGHYDIVCELLKYPVVDPSSDDNFALRMACEFGHYNVVERLLKDERVDPKRAFKVAKSNEKMMKILQKVN